MQINLKYPQKLSRHVLEGQNLPTCHCNPQLFRVLVRSQRTVKHPIVQSPKILAHFKLFLLKSSSSKFCSELNDLKGNPLFQTSFFPFLVPRSF